MHQTQAFIHQLVTVIYLSAFYATVLISISVNYCRTLTKPPTTAASCFSSSAGNTLYQGSRIRH